MAENTIKRSAANAREQIIDMQRWAATIEPKSNPKVADLIQKLSQMRAALEALM